ncbi:glycosyltransferase family 4 protein [Gammaproteobacteria bacterium]|nr:glycosyltransferase family 4 protein [Gammaproteobacteria bacterium]
MKILVVTDGVFPFTMGGSHRLIFESCSKLSDMGHSMTCLVPATNDKSHFKINDSSLDGNLNFDVHQFATNARFKLFKAQKFFTMFKNYIDKNLLLSEYDIINVHYFPALFSLRKLINDRRFFYTFHGPWAAEVRLSYKGRVDGNIFSVISFIYYFLVLPATFIAALIEGYLLRKCKKIMVISNYAKKYLINTYKVPEERISINYCGVDLDKFYYDPSDVYKEYRDKSLKVFITIRRLEKRMGLDLLVRAAYKLKKTESNFIILIYGKGIHEKYLRDLIIKYNVHDKVKLAGYLPENMIRNVISSADLFILPSLDLEGFGLVVLESMACGTPVLVSPIGGAREVVSLYDDNYILDSLEINAISEHLSRIINNNFEFKNNRQDLTRFVASRYSWNRFSRGMLNFFGAYHEET